MDAVLFDHRERFADVGLYENAPYAGIADALSAVNAPT